MEDHISKNFPYTGRRNYKEATLRSFNIGTFDRKYVKKMKKLAIILSLVFFAALTVSGEHGSAKKARSKIFFIYKLLAP